MSDDDADDEDSDDVGDDSDDEDCSGKLAPGAVVHQAELELDGGQAVFSYVELID